MLFRRSVLDDGRIALLPFDAIWGFASPVVALDTDLARSVHAIATALRNESDWTATLVTGIKPASDLEGALIANLSQIGRLALADERVRAVASLQGGIAGYMSRRPRTFERNLRQATRRAGNSVTFECADRSEPASIISRLHGVEQHSWKGLESSGIESPEMSALYGSLVWRLSVLGALRVTFAVRGGRDVGFVLGGVLGTTYRGLQLSFVEEVRALSIGNLLQWNELVRLCDDGVERYDLGMDMEYKRVWAEERFVTRPIVVFR